MQDRLDGRSIPNGAPRNIPGARVVPEDVTTSRFVFDARRAHLEAESKTNPRSSNHGERVMPFLRSEVLCLLYVLLLLHSS
jgi:hypothetical protein